MDTEINKTTSIPENDGHFTKLVKNISKQNIPRCRTQYIPGMRKENKELLKDYISQFNNDFFAEEETITTGESLMAKLSEVQLEK